MTDLNTPWTYDKTTGCIIGSDGHSIAYVSGHMRHDGDPDALACGSMIAAAPQLLAALKDIIDQYEARNLMIGARLGDSIRVFGKPAIAAAEGRTP